MIKRFINVIADDDRMDTSRTARDRISPGEVMVSHHTPLGSPPFETICIRPGVKLIMMNHHQTSGFQMSFEIEQAPISFSFNMSQHYRCVMKDGSRSIKTTERTPGDSVLAYLPKTTGTIITRPGEPATGLSIHFTPSALMDLLDDLPNRFRDIGFIRPEARFFHRTPCNNQIRHVVEQILRCPYQGSIRNLYLEAKSLELLTLKMAEIEPSVLNGFSSSGDMDRDPVRQAHCILLGRLDNPPSLAELSRLVGTNRNKLNMGFRQYYGETVFTVLRNARLSRAHFLLQNTGLSLAEIALAVGYNNQANFSAAFRCRFGRTPNSLRLDAHTSVKPDQNDITDGSAFSKLPFTCAYPD